VWNHNFDYEYKQKLKAPWYSGLAQGLGISVLLRAYSETNQQRFKDCYKKAWLSFNKETKDGGVIYIDKNNNQWIEEYIVSPPTHILNGFIWALWGVYDAWKIDNNHEAKILFKKCINTLILNISSYDSNYWSYYEKSNTFLPMLASPFYHKLHIIQLKILGKISNEIIFTNTALKWEKYNKSFYKRNKALVGKGLFKVFYY
jgi:hypothetical protein